MSKKQKKTIEQLEIAIAWLSGSGQRPRIAKRQIEYAISIIRGEK